MEAQGFSLGISNLKRRDSLWDPKSEGARSVAGTPSKNFVQLVGVEVFLLTPLVFLLLILTASIAGLQKREWGINFIDLFFETVFKL